MLFDLYVEVLLHTSSLLVLKIRSPAPLEKLLGGLIMNMWYAVLWQFYICMHDNYFNFKFMYDPDMQDM